MNTEINLLERKPKKHIVPLLLLSMFLVLVTIAFALLLLQKNYYESIIQSKRNAMNEIENTLVEHQEVIAVSQNLHQVKEDISALEMKKVPHAELYLQILDLLGSTDQFIQYQFMQNNVFVIEAQYPSLEEVSVYVTKLLEQAYVKNTEIDFISYTESMYQAILMVHIDEEILIKELGEID